MPVHVKCPTCRKECSWDDNPHRPFCSDRCQLIDLGAWTEERYRILGGKVETQMGEDEEDEKEDR
jgi:endogenous inhibitor of DNA gyrase (YacG/DUF329 family)